MAFPPNNGAPSISVRDLVLEAAAGRVLASSGTGTTSDPIYLTVQLAADPTIDIGQVQGTGKTVVVTPAVTANSYTAGFVVGGVLTFVNALPTSLNGILQSIALKFKGSVQTGEYDLVIFSANPASGTYADHGAPTYNAADNAAILGVYPLTANSSPLGTHTVYNLDGIGKQINGASTSLFGVLIAKAATTNNLASTSDVEVDLGLMW